MVHGSAEETAPPQHPQGQFEQLAQLKFAMDAQLLDPHVLTLAFRFYNLLCDVCVRIARGSAAGPAEYVPGHRRCVRGALDAHGRAETGTVANAPLSCGSAPLPEAAPRAFTSLPEWMIEDVAEFFLFLCRAQPEALRLAPLEPLVGTATRFVTAASHVRNPYLRAKFVEILFYFAPDMVSQVYGPGNGRHLVALLETHPVFIKHGVAGLALFYQEVESTGAHHQFYEKFNIRQQISIIFKHLWTIPAHHQAFLAQSRCDFGMEWGMWAVAVG